jgi:glutathione S-transferase
MVCPDCRVARPDGGRGGAFSVLQAGAAKRQRWAVYCSRTPPVTPSYTLYGWEVSYYTGKVRSYLRFKGIPYAEIAPNLFDYYFNLRRKTGVVAIPVVRTPAGEWLQDSSEIIDRLEARFPERPIVPATPVQRFAAYLFELWGDEFWLPTGLITRWCHLDENWAFLERDVADNLLPGWPRWLQKKAAAKIAHHMSRYLSNAGVVPAQYELLERWTERQLDALDRHFAAYPFLFGTRPSLGDFGLIGPLYGHLSRDPWSSRHLIAPRRHLSAWLERMNGTQQSAGEFLANDEISATLKPLVGSLLGEMLPYLEATLRVAEPALQKEAVLPRFMDEIEFPLGNGRYRRPAMPYCLWMLQRMLDAIHAMPPADVAAVRAWLFRHDAQRLLDIQMPRLRRAGLCAAPVPSQSVLLPWRALAETRMP